MYVYHTLIYKNHTIINIPEQKILDQFLDLKKHYFAELTKKTKLTRPRTLRILRKLTKANILETKTEANIKYYYLINNPQSHTTLSIVEYNKTTNFLKKHTTLKRVLKMFNTEYKDPLITLIFGSYAKGYATKTSDIDLLLIKETFSKNEIKKIEDLIEIINGRTGLKISPYLMKVNEFKQKKRFCKRNHKKPYSHTRCRIIFQIGIRMKTKLRK